METTESPRPLASSRQNNEFELAADAYMATSCIEFKMFETAVRQAFYAGCQYGINTATKLYRPELYEQP